MNIENMHICSITGTAD